MPVISDEEMMKLFRQEHRRVYIWLTVTWLYTIRLLLWFSRAVMKWPWHFTLLICVPLFIVWIPITYVLGIAHNQRRHEGLEREFSEEYFESFFKLSMYAAVLLVTVVLSESLYGVFSYLGLVLAATVVCLCTRELIRSVRRHVELITGRT